MTDLAYPAEVAEKRGISETDWNALTSSIFPTASPKGILAAWDTAKAKGLDVMKGHVAVVKQNQKNPDTGKWDAVEVVWLTLASQIAIAHRTGVFAGMDPIAFGPLITKTFAGKVKRDGKWTEQDQELTFPESATVCVHRLVGNVPRAFTETVFFEEMVPMSSGLPTGSWVKRPRGMLAKCAKAAALRIAFPECDYSAEEMEDQHLTGTSADVIPFAGTASDETASTQDDAPDVPSSEGEGGLGDLDFGDASFDAPASSFADLPGETLQWINRNLRTALSTKAYAAALSNLRASVEPSYQPMAEKVTRAATEVAQSPKGQSVFEYLEKAYRHAEFERAAKAVQNQVDAGAISQSVGDAAKTVLSFYEAMKSKDLALAA